MNKKNIICLCWMMFFQGMVFYAPIATLYRQQAGLNIFQITLIESISFAISMALEIPWGYVADRIGYKKTLIFCAVLFFLSKIVFWKAMTFNAFLLERLLIAVVISGMSGVDDSMLYLSSGDQSQRMFGWYENAGTAGILLASLIYAIFVKNDYRLSGFLTVISYGVAMISVFFLDDVTPEHKEHVSLHLKSMDLFRKPYLMVYLLGMALLIETHQTITVFLNQLHYQESGIPVALFGMIYIVMTMLSFASGLSEKATKWLGEKQLLMSCGFIMALACLLLSKFTMAIVSVTCIGIMQIALYLLSPLHQTLQHRLTSKENHATQISINTMAMDSVSIVLSLAYGALSNQSLSLALLVGSCLCMVGTYCIIKAYCYLV